jgi:hypothetical protein
VSWSFDIGGGCCVWLGNATGGSGLRAGDETVFDLFALDRRILDGSASCDREPEESLRATARSSSASSSRWTGSWRPRMAGRSASGPNELLAAE